MDVRLLATLWHQQAYTHSRCRIPSWLGHPGRAIAWWSMTRDYGAYPGLEDYILAELAASEVVGRSLADLCGSVNAYYAGDMLECVLAAIMDRLVREGLVAGGFGGTRFRLPRHQPAFS